jgi:hypothetical protein
MIEYIGIQMSGPGIRVENHYGRAVLVEPSCSSAQEIISWNFVGVRYDIYVHHDQIKEKEISQIGWYPKGITTREYLVAVRLE